MNINASDRDSMLLAARIASGELKGEAAIGDEIGHLVEEHIRRAEDAAVARMSRPLGDLAKRIEVAERHISRVRMLDSAEGLLAIELKWACEELRKRDAARAAPSAPPPGRVHEVMVLADGRLGVRSCTDRTLCWVQESDAFPGRKLHTCAGCLGIIVQVAG